MLNGSKEEGPIEVEASKWLENERTKGRYLLEDVRLVTQWNQSLTLLWFEDIEEQEVHLNEVDREPALRELDGILPWPAKRKRR